MGNYAREVGTPPPLGAAARLHCTDADDQKFIDLAIAKSAHTLVSRDKALLRLARKARDRHGVRICRPEAWSVNSASPCRGAATRRPEVLPPQQRVEEADLPQRLRAGRRAAVYVALRCDQT